MFNSILGEVGGEVLLLRQPGTAGGICRGRYPSAILEAQRPCVAPDGVASMSWRGHKLALTGLGAPSVVMQNNTSSQKLSSCSAMIACPGCFQPISLR